MKSAFFLLSMLVGCGGGVQDLGQVNYTIGEQPIASGFAGSCLPRLFTMDYSAFYPTLLRDLKWAIGADMDVLVSWPNRRDCSSDGRLGGAGSCPDVDADFVPLGTTWTITYTTAKPTRSFTVALRAAREGEGGFKTIVRGKEFDPPFTLRVGPASAIRFERSLDSRYADVIPGAITEIHAVRGSGNMIVAATLRDSAGEHICGAVPATVTITPPGLFSVEALRQDPYVNLPFRIVAGNAPGTGTFEIRVGDIRASLTVIVD